MPISSKVAIGDVADAMGSRPRRQWTDKSGNAADMSVATATAIGPRPEQLPATAADGDGRTSWLLCRAGTHLCAIPLEHVIEIMRVLPIEVIAGAPPYVRGLSIIRGSAVPVVDAGLLLGDHATKSERLVAIRSGSRTIALATDAVLGIRAIGAQALHDLPPLLRDAASETIAAIGTLDAELLFFLRAARIVPEDLLERLESDGASP
jgi:purine-binding chemotaxis protein CheW